MYNDTYEYNRLNEICVELAVIHVLPHKKGDCQNECLKGQCDDIDWAFC